MKKTLCLSFVLFATAMSLSATSGAKSDAAPKRIEIVLPTTTSKAPIATPGCTTGPICGQMGS